MRHKAYALLLTILALFLTTSAWAVPLTGFIEGTADTGWQGTYAVQLTDGTVVTGDNQISGFPEHGFQSLPLVTSGCVAGPGCVTVTNLATSTTFTMNPLVLFLEGSVSLGNLGSLSWGAQPFWMLPGDPSPTAAVLARASGTLGGTTLTPSTFSFGFNSTLTASFVSVAGGQALSSLRLDFTDGTAPPTSRTLLQGNVLIDNGVPVALGTSLTVPEPSPILLLSLSMAGLFWWHAATARRRR